MKLNFQKNTNSILLICSFLAILFNVNSLVAQPYDYSNAATVGQYLDLFVINDDHSNHGAGIRLESAQGYTSKNYSAYSIYNDYQNLHFFHSANETSTDAGTNLMTLTKSAQLGIGIPNPSGKLNVVGNSGAYSSIGTMIIGDVSGVNLRFGYNTEDVSTWIQAHGNSSLTINRMGNYTLLNENGGRVGIGTHHPNGKLNVVGNSGAYNSIGTMIIGDASTANLRIGYNPADTSTWIQAHASSSLIINGMGNTTLLNTDGGNVGIGTFAPNEKLHVNGNIKSANIEAADISANKVILDIGSFPDYVFKEGYDLLSLQEVEAYISQNGRLPKMPSENEVKTQGMDVGQINVLLVEKIEELTLHLIEMEKHQKLLKAQIDELSQKMENTHK